MVDSLFRHEEVKKLAKLYFGQKLTNKLIVSVVVDKDSDDSLIDKIYSYDIFQIS